MQFNEGDVRLLRPETQSFIAFSEDLVRNEWFRQNGVNIYCRKSIRLINQKVERTFEIANISIRDEGRGIFTEILNQLETTELNIDYFYIENVNSGRLTNFLLKRGYEALYSDAFGTTFIMKHTLSVFK